MARPIHIVVLINLLLFPLLFFYGEAQDPLILAIGGGIILLTILSQFAIVKGKMGDPYIFLILSLLCSISIAMLYRLDPFYGIRQTIWYGVGLILFFLTYVFFRWVKKWDEYFYLYVIAGVGLFAATYFLGTTIKGANNWIRIGGFTFQPAEAIKLIFVFMIASYFKHTQKVKNVYVFLGIVYLHMLFLMLQRDMGMVLLFYAVFISLFYVHIEDYRLILYNTVPFGLMAVISYLTMNHVRVRFEAWLNPWQDIAGRGYQITQSLFAIAGGGFFGTGIGLGNPGVIPEVHTDFIFSAIAEELGVFGAIAMILLYFILIYRGFKIVLTINEPFRKTVALGITLLYGYQTFIIVGGVIKLIPLTGITLPFVSYGGSAFVSGFVAFGILQALSTKWKPGRGRLEIERK
ncbi:cell cycle protein [Alkaliphilus metalliredigens QYMF]|uniref:Cell cycle protein n=1 Tax=Alkaliphilus metalliredigens (strain QYMF) TaxID=293826 RepID=A6TK46_ALKMQ|nr:FtsW/RodA/SpoVE family cell cycle protein [Alkaliphilus metalliredigens]ABR46564.1 cell cycle protein [Alkaliphilus metalliredigens QYMF]